MAKKIEIFENTLLKLLVRRGSDQERQQVVLSEGELGFTTDTKRVYIGDGQTQGGIVVGGSSFLGSAINVPATFTNAAAGDTAFDSDDNVMYTYLGGGASNPDNWSAIGGKYSAGDNTITITNTNQIKVNKVAAGNFNTNVAGNSIEIDDNGKIALASTANINSITVQSGDFLTIPGKFAVAGTATRYTLPVGGTQNNYYLGTDINGNLTWSSPTNSTSFVAGTASQIPVGSIMPFVSSAAAPTGWLLCNGQSVPGASYRELSAVIGSSYGGNGINFNVPDLRNKLIYGVENGPATSTTFRVASGTNASLSAAGALYIIKAKPDEVVNATITVTSPLTATLDGLSITNTKKTALRGELVVGMPPLDIVGIVTNLIYPVGSILLTTDTTNPNTRFPGTTWAQVSEGLFLAGVGTGVDKNSLSQEILVGDLNSSLGEYKHTLITSELPSHTHGCQSDGAHSHNCQENGNHRHGLTHPDTGEQFYVFNDQNNSPTGANVTREQGPTADNDAHYYPFTSYGGTHAHTIDPNGAHTHTIDSAGSGNSHNNIPPCYGVYVWERVS